MPSKATREFRDRVVNQKTVWAAGAYDALSARFIEASRPVNATWPVRRSGAGFIPS